MYVRSAPDSVYLVLSLISVLMSLSSNQRTRRRSDGWLGEAQKRHSTDASCIRSPSSLWFRIVSARFSVESDALVLCPTMFIIQRIPLIFCLLSGVSMTYGFNDDFTNSAIALYPRCTVPGSTMQTANSRLRETGPARVEGHKPPEFLERLPGILVSQAPGLWYVMHQLILLCTVWQPEAV